MKFLLDTDILVDFFHDQEYAKELIVKLADQGSIHTSIVSITELRTGFTSGQAQFFLPRLYKLIRIVKLDSLETAELAGQFRFEYRKKGKMLSTVDTLIGATATIGNYQLVTRNKKDFPMPQVTFYPLKSSS